VADEEAENEGDEEDEAGDDEDEAEDDEEAKDEKEELEEGKDEGQKKPTKKDIVHIFFRLIESSKCFFSSYS